MTRSEMPTATGLENSLKLLQEGYEFIINRSESLETDVFETRLLGEKTICLTGREAAELFYDETRFKREGAAPLPLKKTLFGEGGVQGMDGTAHRHRKAMFMQLWTGDAVREIRDLTRQYWDHFAKEWESRDEINLYQEAQKLLTCVVCKWAGVPLADEDIPLRAEQLGDMYESPADLSLGHFKGWISRSEAEDWLKDLVRAVRNDELVVAKDRALYLFSWHKDLEQNLLSEGVVAVELLNLLRPTVANAIYIDFLLLAIHDYPDQVEALKDGDDAQLQRFVQEVRRYYPFFPFTAARVKTTFNWRNFEFIEETLTLLDLYGTNHHPDEWTSPEQFDPERFADWDGSPFSFIPQGGGDYDTGHRCAGEWITLALMKESLDALVNRLSYSLPPQDMTFSLAEVPSAPKDRIRLSQVRLH